MRLQRTFTSVLVPALFALGACVPASGDDPGTGGSSGTAGTGSGTAGTGSGTAGISGAAGTSGAAGAGDAGATGSGAAGAGAAGTTGTAGSIATGTAGTGAGTSGTGGGTAGAAAGRGGTGGAAGAAGGRGGSGGATGGARGGTGGGAGSVGAGGTGTVGTGTAGAPGLPGYNPNFKEFYGDDCTVATPANVSVSTLNDLFQNLDGSRMSKKSDWKCRRAELKKIVETYIHGAKPAKPPTVTGTVSSTQIRVHVADGTKMIDFMVSVSLPTGTSGAVPAIIGLGGSSLDAAIVRGEGVATMNFDHQMMASESSRSGLFTTIVGTTGASAQVGWAWGVSRIIDVLVDEKAAGRNNIIDPTAIGVTGCSRNGKGAFTVGAFDERIALGIPQESGTGGVSAFRVVNTAPVGPNGMPAQSLTSAWTEAQGWFGTVFGNYRSNVNVIPGDTHSLVAMYAPRGLLVLDNSRIGELGSTAQHAASAAGGRVYEALGVGKNIEYHGGNTTDPHNHCMFYTSQADPLRRAIRAHLTRKAAPDGRIAPAAVATADLTKWIPWTAPALSDQ